MNSNYFSIGKHVERLVFWLNTNASGFFDFISDLLSVSVVYLEKALNYPSAIWIILFASAICWRISGKGLALFTVFGFSFCLKMGLWEQTMLTTALVSLSALLALLIAIPLGIFTAKNKIIGQIIRPALDLMQTMPAWVYLVPAVMLFGLGRSPAIIATVIFATPPAIRLTDLGIRQVPVEQVEAGRAFGASQIHILFKIELPSALPTIMAGVNQCIMFALAMVVVAGLIGAEGLGGEVVGGLTRMMLGTGIRAGLSIVILAIIFDRITQSTIDLFSKEPKDLATSE